MRHYIVCGKLLTIVKRGFYSFLGPKRLKSPKLFLSHLIILLHYNPIYLTITNLNHRLQNSNETTHNPSLTNLSQNHENHPRVTL